MIVPTVSLSMKLIYTQIKCSNVNEIKNEKIKKNYMSDKGVGGNFLTKTEKSEAKEEKIGISDFKIWAWEEDSMNRPHRQ